MKSAMKQSIHIIFLFCVFSAYRCENTVNDEVETVHKDGSNGERSGKMVNYDDFMGELDGYPDYNYNNAYDWGKSVHCAILRTPKKVLRFGMIHTSHIFFMWSFFYYYLLDRESKMCAPDCCEIHT